MNAKIFILYETVVSFHIILIMEKVLASGQVSNAPFIVSAI